MRNEIHDPYSELCDCPMCERAMYEMIVTIMDARVKAREQKRIAKLVLVCVFLSLVLYGAAIVL